MDRAELINAIASLTDRELGEVFYAALSGRQVENDSIIDDVYVIGRAFKSPGEAAEIVLAALPSARQDGLGDRWKFEGKCQKCMALVAGIAALNACPICGSSIECT